MDVHEKILSDDPSVNWGIYKYDPGLTHLDLIKSGDGGPREIITYLDEAWVAHILARVTTESNLKKIILISFYGTESNTALRSKVRNIYYNTECQLKGFSMNIEATSISDVVQSLEKLTGEKLESLDLEDKDIKITVSPTLGEESILPVNNKKPSSYFAQENKPGVSNFTKSKEAFIKTTSSSSPDSPQNIIKSLNAQSSHCNSPPNSSTKDSGGYTNSINQVSKTENDPKKFRSGFEKIQEIFGGGIRGTGQSRQAYTFTLNKNTPKQNKPFNPSVEDWVETNTETNVTYATRPNTLPTGVTLKPFIPKEDSNRSNSLYAKGTGSEGNKSINKIIQIFEPKECAATNPSWKSVNPSGINTSSRIITGSNMNSSPPYTTSHEHKESPKTPKLPSSTEQPALNLKPQTTETDKRQPKLTLLTQNNDDLVESHKTQLHTVRVTHSYEKTDANELSIKEGEEITNVIFASDSWWYGTKGNEAGLFPSDRVKCIDP